MTKKHYWVFWRRFDAPYAMWPSLESCKQQARGLAGKELDWYEAPDGPQGAGRHWYPRGNDDLLIIEVEHGK